MKLLKLIIDSTLFVFFLFKLTTLLLSPFVFNII